MTKTLNCVVIDDDPIWLEILGDLCEASKYMKSFESFNHPQKFLDKADTINYDLLITDIMMPEVDGIALAKMQKRKPVILVTGEDGMLRNALTSISIDVLVKPMTLERFEMAMQKAHFFCRNSNKPKTHASFSVAELREKVSINLSDILLVVSDETDSRNKVAYLKNGIKYTLMESTFDELLFSAPQLVKVNRTHLISLGTVKSYRYDLVTLNEITPNHKIRQVTLSDTCRKEFMRRIESY